METATRYAGQHQCPPRRQPPPTTQHSTCGPSSKGWSSRKASVGLSAAPATSRRGQRLLRHLRAALPVVKKPWCLQTLLLDSSESQTLHFSLVGLFDNGHKCPASNICWHKHLLAQRLKMWSFQAIRMSYQDSVCNLWGSQTSKQMGRDSPPLRASVFCLQGSGLAQSQLLCGRVCVGTLNHHS